MVYNPIESFKTERRETTSEQSLKVYTYLFTEMDNRVGMFLLNFYIHIPESFHFSRLTMRNRHGVFS